VVIRRLCYGDADRFELYWRARLRGSDSAEDEGTDDFWKQDEGPLSDAYSPERIWKHKPPTTQTRGQLTPYNFKDSRDVLFLSSEPDASRCYVEIQRSIHT